LEAILGPKAQTLSIRPTGAFECTSSTEAAAAAAAAAVASNVNTAKEMEAAVLKS
jgi:hypothetical protein